MGTSLHSLSSQFLLGTFRCYVENVPDMSSTCRRDMTMSPICRDTSRVSRHLMRGRHVIILKTCLDNVVTCHDVLTYCLCEPRSSNFFMTCRGDIQRHVLHVARHVRLTDIWDPLVTCRVCDIINIALGLFCFLEMFLGRMGGHTLRQAKVFREATNYLHLRRSRLLFE